MHPQRNLVPGLILASALILASLACGFSLPVPAPNNGSGPVTPEADLQATASALETQAAGLSGGVSTPVPAATPTQPPLPTSGPAALAVAGDDGSVHLGDMLILDTAAEAPGCSGVLEITYSPTADYFVVVLQCFESDNEAYIFRADGSDKRHITGQWDFISYSDYHWSSDGQAFEYQRINSCCAVPPADAPPAGLVSYNVQTGEKTLLQAAPAPAGLYRVVNVASNDVLNVRAGPGADNPIVGIIPPDGTGIQITGPGTANGTTFWVPIRYMAVEGWVNQSYLELIQP